MTFVGGFVHLYHIWGIYGAITALIFGRSAYRGWRKTGGQWRDVPRDVTGWFFGGLARTAGDWWRFSKWFLAGLIGIGFRRDKGGWPEIDLFFPDEEYARWPRNQTLLLGITLGGVSRFLTALYWAEKNTAWMNEGNVFIPAIPIVVAILADMNHQFTAWHKRKWIVRMALTLGS